MSLRHFFWLQLSWNMGCATGITWVDAKDAAKHPTRHENSLHDEEFPFQYASGAEVKTLS